MATKRPELPLSMNLITPVTLAKRVSSLPRPTLAPGLIGVPRCRTMMVPPCTSCPPNAFTPRRCALESRPFLELPNPFLCAIANPFLTQNLCGAGAAYFFLLFVSVFLAAGFLAGLAADFFAALFLGAALAASAGAG